MMTDEHAAIASFNGNPNVGLFAYCNDEYCLVGRGIMKKDLAMLKNILKVPVYSMNIAGTSLVGVFLAGNSNCLLIPHIVFDEELKQLDKIRIKYKVIDTKLTALGNNVLCNDNGALVSENFDVRVVKEIKDALDVNVKRGTIEELDNVGSLAVVRKDKCLISIDASDKEIKVVEKLLKVECSKTSLNMGLPYIHSGIIVNSNGFVVSEMSTGVEMMQAEQGLGFLEEE